MSHLFVHVPSALLSAAMNGGVCLCVLMAVLAAGALAQPVPAADPARPGAQPEEEAPRRQLRAVQKVDGEPRAHLGALLARYIQQARKGTDAPSSVGSSSLPLASARGSQPRPSSLASGWLTEVGNPSEGTPGCALELKGFSLSFPNCTAPGSMVSWTSFVAN